MTNQQSQYIQELGQQPGFSAEALVKVAKSPKSPIHELFEWDDKKAGHEHRLAQARGFIRKVEIRFVHSRRVVDVSMFVHDTTAGSKQGYVSLREVKGNEQRRRDTLLAEFRAVVAILERARSIAAFLEMDDLLEEWIAQITTAEATLEKEEEAAA